ncbi:VOC family protein [Altererythrobacter sp. MF3-039]|uniref:VOC family protein n=1 Tax=Altererythrobacter sp. MF3-039 TaxID=3252901 RepID=UPI00390C54FF
MSGWVSRLSAIVAIALASSACAHASSNEETSAASDVVTSEAHARLISQGWRETLVSVSDLAEMERFYHEVLGWEIRTKGEVPREQLAAWNLPGEASASFVLVANPQTDRGFVRIVDFDGVPQRRIREHDQAWETGGIYNMNIRVADIAAASTKTTQAGWQAPSTPVNFIFGPFDVWEWIPRHPDGVRVALMERVSPPLTGWPHLKTSSRAFNSTQIVADLERAAAFYEGILGFEVYLDHTGPSTEPGEHVLGLSREAMTSVSRTVKIVNPPGSPNDGSVELLEFQDYSGRDFSEHAVPPNLGNLMLRFPVSDLGALVAHFDKHEIPLEYQPIERELAPYGKVKIAAVRAPDGAWLEFFEEAES